MKIRFFILILISYTNSFASKAEELEAVHFAYANYLGNGIYKTTDQDASLISMPFSYELGSIGKTSYGLRLPLSLGFFDFQFSDITNLDLPDEVGTATFTPGVAIHYQYNLDWTIETYIDAGYGRNLTTNRGVKIHSAGVSALYSFDYKKYDSVWATRLYYAHYSGNGYQVKDTYAALQTGVDVGLPQRYKILDYSFQPRLFATAFWYFSEVDFISLRERKLDEEANVSLSNSIEFGITLKFAKTIGYSWAGIDRIGLSYRFSENFNAVRLLFSLPI
ncbi:hypothetical protein [Colwellia sp. E2M01]|uniref:hypothetical protein n=1 Tax=Colwellia sp. E2M01 TaxID=2841561 RepID=UPI001C0A13E3|nr:hypothetical protein [Colwellia sp. E2M01]MBU2871408.1 hypothetical protein [Colwellia sp. E2M01]